MYRGIRRACAPPRFFADSRLASASGSIAAASRMNGSLVASRSAVLFSIRLEAEIAIAELRAREQPL